MVSVNKDSMDFCAPSIHAFRSLTFISDCTEKSRIDTGLVRNAQELLIEAIGDACEGISSSRLSEREKSEELSRIKAIVDKSTVLIGALNRKLEILNKSTSH